MRKAGYALAGLATMAGLLLTFQVRPLAAPTSPIRAAFVYPWYPENWNQGSNYHPALGQYDSSNPTVIAAQIEAMKWGGISVGISSWWGQGTPTDQRLPAMLAAAAGKSFSWTAYYELEGYGDPSSAQIGSDLAYLATYAASPEWLRVGGRPVLFVYGSGSDGCAMAGRWAAAPGRSSWYIVLKVFSGYLSCANQPDSWHQYGPAAREDRQGSFSFSISPGFWATGASPRLARDLTAWNKAVCDMTAATVQWQLITTFNEWGEGTAVEPATEWQSGSGYGSYLDTLRNPQCSSPAPSATPTSTPSATPSSTPSATATITPTLRPTPTPSPRVTPSPTSAPTPTASPIPTASPTPISGAIRHVVIVWLENHEYGSVTASSMPYLTGLAAQYGLASNFYAVSHPSLPNYLAVWSGSTQGVSDDNTHNLSAASLSTQFQNAGLSWQAAMQDYPTTAGCHTGSSYSGGVDLAGVSGTYVRKHDPPMSFTSTGGANCANITSLAAIDLSRNLIFMAPNLCNDAHDCSLTTADNFLKAFLPTVFAAPDWSHTLLIVSFDEGTTSSHGGGHIYTMVARAGLSGFTSSAYHDHYGLTRTVEDIFGLPCLLNACSATPLTEFLP